MSFAYCPFFTGDYLRDTRGLSPMAHGVYLMFLFNQWDTRKPIPLDEQDAAGIANARSQDEIEAMRRVLDRFFIKTPAGYYSRRMQLEIERTEAISAKRKSAGFKGYEAIAKHLPGKSRASARQVPLSPSPSPSLYKNTVGLERGVGETNPAAPAAPAEQTVGIKTSKPKADLRGSRLDPDFELPDEWRDWSIECYPRLTQAEVMRAFVEFRNYWSDVPGKNGLKLRWFQTWQNNLHRRMKNA